MINSALESKAMVAKSPRKPVWTKERTMDEFTTGYIECALWSSVSDDEDGITDEHSISDLAPETLRKMECDCQAFTETYRDWLDKANEMGRDDSHLGHDFWLSRNGHGTGFWDRGLGALGDKLHEHAKVMGSIDLYVGDDGLIYEM